MDRKCSIKATLIRPSGQSNGHAEVATIASPTCKSQPIRTQVTSQPAGNRTSKPRELSHVHRRNRIPPPLTSLFDHLIADQLITRPRNNIERRESHRRWLWKVQTAGYVLKQQSSCLFRSRIRSSCAVERRVLLRRMWQATECYLKLDFDPRTRMVRPSGPCYHLYPRGTLPPMLQALSGHGPLLWGTQHPTRCCVPPSLRH